MTKSLYEQAMEQKPIFESDKQAISELLRENRELKASNEKLRNAIDCALTVVTHPQVFRVTVTSPSASARLKLFEEALVAAGIRETEQVE